MGRDAYLKQSLGTLYGHIKQSRVLLVGAGGIGCELLKNLALTGYGEIHIIDLDTIDLSNLNRQFLFRQEHVKKPKALVAKESAGKFNPNVKLEAHHANIKDSQFNVEWFQSFNLVFNALDNLDARRHVNKMCVAADVPLIESGTTGYNGQVQVIKKGKTRCYDCDEKAVPKTFPVCTIRSTPSQPIHCIVWAKSYLLPELFGASEVDAPELDHSEDFENAEEIANLQKEAQALKKIRETMGTEDFAKKVFDKVFTDDIERLRGMEDMWKSRTTPVPLSYAQLSQDASTVDAEISSNDQNVWSLVENFAVFKDSLQRLSTRLQAEKSSKVSNEDVEPILEFDKDDVDTLDFVTAAANLRSQIFGIEQKSKFDVKQMAGNIIPAIATTNAMTAALCVLQAFKVMKDDYERAKMVFLEKSGARALNSEALRPPNPQCPVCGVVSSRLVIDLSRATLNDLVEDVLRLQLGYGEEFTISNEVGIVYDPDLEDNLPRKFSELGIKDASFLTIIDDDDDEPRVNLQLSISEKPLPEESKPLHLASTPDIARKPKPIAIPERNGLANGAGQSSNGVLGRRKRESDEAEAVEERPTKKRADVATSGPTLKVIASTNEAIVIDDSGDGAILIDDD